AVGLADRLDLRVEFLRVHRPSSVPMMPGVRAFRVDGSWQIDVQLALAPGYLVRSALDGTGVLLGVAELRVDPDRLAVQPRAGGARVGRREAPGLGRSRADALPSCLRSGERRERGGAPGAALLCAGLDGHLDHVGHALERLGVL